MIKGSLSLWAMNESTIPDCCLASAHVRFFHADNTFADRPGGRSLRAYIKGHRFHVNWCIKSWKYLTMTDPDTVPRITLNNGAKMPIVGYGTCYETTAVSFVIKIAVLACEKIKHFIMQLFEKAWG